MYAQTTIRRVLVLRKSLKYETKIAYALVSYNSLSLARCDICNFSSLNVILSNYIRKLR